MTPTDKMQEELLKALEDDTNVQMLYDVWSLLRVVPSKAVEILMQFKDVSNSAKHATDEIENTLKRFNAIEPELDRLNAGVEKIKGFSQSVSSLDDDVVMNRLARLVSMAGQISNLKKDGTLDLLTDLLSKK